MGMGRIPYFGVVHACGFDGATRRGTYLLVSDRGRFGGLRSGGTRLGCVPIAIGNEPSIGSSAWLNGRWGMGEGKGGCGRRS